MPIQRINQFPEGSGSLTGDDIFLFMDDPANSGITKKISLNQIANTLNISNSGNNPDGGLTLEQVDDRVSQLLVAGTGVSLNYNDENNSLTISFNTSGVGSGNCCNPFDQDLNTYNFPTFSGVNLSNNTSLAQGTFDNGTGGGGGISLNCAVGYELNWQGGHLKNTYDNGAYTADLLCDSPISLPGTGLAYMRVDSSGITFSDDTRQITAYTGCSCVGGSGGNSPYTTGVGLNSIQPIYGNNIASGNYSNVTGGKDAIASLYGEEAHAAGKFFSAGDAQVRKFILRTSTNAGIAPSDTINNVVVYPLLLDGGENASILQRINIPNDSTWHYNIKVVARQDNTGYSAAYEFKGVLKVYELYGASLMPYMETILYEDVADWHVYIRTFGNTLDIYARVPDTTAGIVYWVAYVEAVQVIAPPPPDEPPLPSSSSSGEGTSSSSSEGGTSSSSSEGGTSSSSSEVTSSSSSDSNSLPATIYVCNNTGTYASIVNGAWTLVGDHYEKAGAFNIINANGYWHYDYDYNYAGPALSAYNLNGILLGSWDDFTNNSTFTVGTDPSCPSSSSSSSESLPATIYVCGSTGPLPNGTYTLSDINNLYSNRQYYIDSNGNPAILYGYNNLTQWGFVDNYNINNLSGYLLGTWNDNNNSTTFTVQANPC